MNLHLYPSASMLQKFGHIMHDLSNYELALDSYQVMMELLPCIVMIGLNLQQSHLALISENDSLACDAAACVIQTRQYCIVLKLLEEGHVVFWSQALRLHMPMIILYDVAPRLEEKLRHISFALEQVFHQDLSKSPSDTL